MRLTFWSGGLKDYWLGRILFACPRRMERLCFLAKIQRGLDQADAGETFTHKEAKECLLT